MYSCLNLLRIHSTAVEAFFLSVIFFFFFWENGYQNERLGPVTEFFRRVQLSNTLIKLVSRPSR